MITTHTVTVTRRTGEVETTGDWLEVTSSTFSAAGSIQPVTGRELEQLPENLRTRARLKFYTLAELRTAWVDPVSGGQPPDEVETADGRTLVVLSTLDWSAHARSTAHRKYILGEPDEGDGL